MISRAIANEGIPLKIQTQWTENDYWERRYPDSDEMDCVAVRGWLVRINGKKYPRQLGNEGIDWTYRYTTKDRDQAIKNALQEARLTIW